MSFNGFVQFERNLRTLMDSETFIIANDAERLNMGYRLLKSDYGLGKLFCLGKKNVKQLSNLLPNSKTKKS